MARKNNNRKRKAIHDEPGDPNNPNNNNNNQSTHWTPNEIQAQPKLYLQISEELRCQPPFAAATLLGLNCDDDIDVSTLSMRGELMRIVARNCPNLMAEDSSLFRKLLDAGDENFVMLLSRLPNMSRVSWNQDLAMVAVNKTPFFYRVLPKTLKQNNITLAVSAMMSIKDDALAANGTILQNIVKDVQLHCPDMFAQPSTNALHTILASDNEDLVAAVLIEFGERIGWDKALAKFAKTHFPFSRSFFPAKYRKDRVDAQKVMALLLPLKVTADEFSYEAMLSQVDAVIYNYPDFFRDRNDVQQLFCVANETVTCIIVEKLSCQLPWDKDLVRLAAETWHHEHPNMAETEMERIYKEDDQPDCKHHLPLGMLLSSIMAETVNAVNAEGDAEDDDDEEEDWPDFMNHCGCALHQNDAVFWTVLEFVEAMLQRSVVAQEVQVRLVRLLHQIQDKVQHQRSFQTFLTCITVSAEGGPLDVLFRGDDATSVALKRHIAEFLMGAPIQQQASLKRDVFKLVYCVFTLPAVFREEMRSASNVLNYGSPFRRYGMSYYNFVLSNLYQKYQDKNTAVSDYETRERLGA
jgi:hypothetical protein